MKNKLVLAILSLFGLGACTNDSEASGADDLGSAPVQPESFWEIIAEAKASAAGNHEAYAKFLRAHLAEQTLEHIQQFDTQFRELHNDANRWGLWGAAYIMNGGCGDDGFDYFRNWLISQGEKIYAAAIANPDSLAEFDFVLDPGEGVSFEYLAYVAMEAYREKSGKEMPYPNATTMRDTQGTPWEESDLASILPKLAAKYGWK
jgi:hypothetical protein